MAWIAISGGTQGGAGGGVDSDDELIAGGGGGDGGVPRFRGVPLCGAAMCSSKGMPPPRPAQPGIDCVNRDRPCLPCDIVNLKLRVAVAGPRMKRAVAECQKRYFCRVWNILFSWMFPDHKPVPCRGLKSGDVEVTCRRKSTEKRAKRTGAMLPYGADPRRRLAPPEEMKVEKPAREVVPVDPVKDKEEPAPVSRPTMKKRGSGLRYNIWDMPMPDSSKENRHVTNM